MSEVAHTREPIYAYIANLYKHGPFPHKDLKKFPHKGGYLLTSSFLIVPLSGFSSFAPIWYLNVEEILIRTSVPML